MESKKKIRNSQLSLIAKPSQYDPKKRFQLKYQTISCRFCLNYPLPLYTIPFQLWEVTDSSIIKNAQKSLALKYCQSQAFYYTKTINDFLNNEPTSIVIKLKEVTSLYQVDEWMRRFYQEDESNEKIQLLTEYYRFHNEIPRLFMIPSSDTMNDYLSYHDKKRRIDYFKIAKQIEDENKRNPDKPPKGIVGDNPQNLKESQSMSETREQKDKKHYGNLLEDLTEDQKKNESTTLQEINQKLDDIVKGMNNNGLELEMRQSKNKSNDDLNKFLQYLKEQEMKKNKIKMESDNNGNKLRKYMFNQPLKLQSPKSSRVNGQQSSKSNSQQQQQVRNLTQFILKQVSSNTLFKQLLSSKNSKQNIKKKKQSFEVFPNQLKQCIQLLQQSKPSSKSKQKINTTLKTPKQYDQLQKIDHDIIPLSAKYGPPKQSWFPSAKQNQTKSPNQASSKIGSQTHRVTTQVGLPKSASTLNKILSPISSTMTKKELSDFFLLQIKTMKSQLSISKPKVQSVIQTRQFSKRQSKGMRMSLEQINHYHARSDFNQI